MTTLESQFSLSGPWAEMWQNPEADATVLTAMLISKYGEEALDWDPITIRLEIQEDFHVTPVDEVMNKLCAMQIVMASSDFFERIDAFINICNTLSEGDPFFEVFTPLEPEEIAYAIATVAMNRDLKPFNPTIKRYVREVLKSEGFTKSDFPEIFSVIFDESPSDKEARRITATSIMNKDTAAGSNRRNIADMLTHNLGVLLGQLQKLPGLKGVDGKLLEQGTLLALGAAEADRASIEPVNEPNKVSE